MENQNDTYSLRYNKKIYLIKLLYELIICEKNKDNYSPDFEDDKFYNYIDNILKLLFNYIFDVNSDYYTHDLNNNIDINISSSSSEASSDVFLYSEEKEKELSDFFNFNTNNINQKEVYHNENDTEHELDNFEDTKNHINIISKENTINNNINTDIKWDPNLSIIETLNLKNSSGENEQNQHIKSVFSENNDDLSDVLFNYHLNCDRNTKSIKDTKKTQKEILSIYYKSFSTTVIDMLLNNNKIEISDIILFFIFDHVKNIEDIRSFFSKGYYTFDKIYSYIQHCKCENNGHLKKDGSKFPSIDNHLKFNNANEKKDNDINPQNSDICNAQTIKMDENSHTLESQPQNKLLFHTKNLEEKSIGITTEMSDRKPSIATNHTKDLCDKNFLNCMPLLICENEKINAEVLINDMLNKSENHIDVKNSDILKLKNIKINENSFTIENYEFQLNKSSVLLNKFIFILNLQLEKERHFKICTDIYFLKNLSLSFLEASKPWIFYWCIHTIYILYNDFEIEQKLCKDTFSTIKKNVFYYLNKIKNKNDGFGGGLNQYTHITTTYAAICVFIYLNDNENDFLGFIDKKKLHSYILQLKCKDGSFRLHKDGEIDMRGTYCAIAVCSMCHILTKSIKKNVAKYILSCQNYEGGFTSEKFQESHGGYTYCALATLCILGKIKKVNLNKLMLWVINRQGNLEGAFTGRTNKLVDACYSFWIGSIFFIINEIYTLKKLFKQSETKQKSINKNAKTIDNGNYPKSDEFKAFEINNLKENTNILFNMNYLKLYLLLCSQSNKGGMKDKPKEKVDYYHTCYALSGLTLVENYLLAHKQYFEDTYNVENINKLNKIHILYNITVQKVYKSYNYFSPDFPLNENKINHKVGKGAYFYLKNLVH
ncbi:protein farnesyltransferase subunit beta, putative [Plasmodium vinckei vinckei]|uniref:Protein farnesyltransferase subunit beta n=1 Tax=Plasmodium vinckei vinckei TaxID=54757 RepID=A0A449BT43_PLAVN|nr:protein farnesyltransferase subunit beta, putative [Plasmodium vinckei vinckei]KEG02402.1 protein farnesyltransferase subunit beta [Plasmodium vinckei vinckei]VEV56646.1 protein farnesyltransferase subunit beta, putative [Plasmodium vinckei vinckei]